MEATKQELEWAVAIKKAAEVDAHVNAHLVSDLEFLQHAIIAKDNVDKALKRLKRMQEFKKQYGIKLDGSHAEGMRDLQTFGTAHPGFALAIGVLKNDTTDSELQQQQQAAHVMCADYAQFLAKTIKSDESYAVLMRGLFYFIQASQPNIGAMRAGLFVLANGKSAGWRNVSLAMDERVLALLSNTYPIRINQIVMMNANILLRLFGNFLRMFVSAKVWEKHVFAGPLDDFLRDSPRYSNQPDALPRAWGGSLEANDLERIVSENLQERYALAAKFTL